MGKPKLYFKVLEKGKSCSGGNHKWDLPRDGKPGKWHRLPKGMKPVLCRKGFHVTRRPAKWYSHRNGCTVYVAEIRGEITGRNVLCWTDPTKVAASECRLLRKATVKELEKYGLFLLSGNERRRQREPRKSKKAVAA